MNDTIEMIEIPKSEPAGNMLAVIERAALNSDVDVNKMRALLDMQKEIHAKEAEMAFTRAMIQVQKEITPIVKSSWNEQTRSNYAKAKEIDKVLTPIYTRHGFILMFGTEDSVWSDKGYIRIVCDVCHEAGHSRKFQYDLPPDDAGIKGTVNKTPVHASASTVTYGQRYLKILIFNIPFADDKDGNTQKEPEPLITEKQEADLHALIDELGDAGSKGKQAMFKWLGIDSIDQIPAKHYKKVVAGLEKRRAA
jgi:hypothetical protein